MVENRCKPNNIKDLCCIFPPYRTRLILLGLRANGKNVLEKRKWPLLATDRSMSPTDKNDLSPTAQHGQTKQVVR